MLKSSLTLLRRPCFVFLHRNITLRIHSYIRVSGCCHITTSAHTLVLQNQSHSIFRNMSAVCNGNGKDNHGKRIVWIDMEMTGLDIDNDHILEVACLVTDADLNIVALGPNLVLKQSDEVLNNMDEWNVSHHGESGLTEASKNSKIDLISAEKTVLDFLKQHVPQGKCPLAGNSVYMDRLFIRKYMPNINSYLHYRIIDVSSIKELAKRWFPREFSRVPLKSFSHRALQDIEETIQELKYYRENIFKS